MKSTEKGFRLTDDELTHYVNLLVLLHCSKLDISAILLRQTETLYNKNNISAEFT